MFSDTINAVSGSGNVTEMWRRVYSELNSSLLDNGNKSLVHNKIEYISMHGEWVVTVNVIATALVEQTRAKLQGRMRCQWKLLCMEDKEF